jgi:pyruvate formate lyase activating enzyme
MSSDGTSAGRVATGGTGEKVVCHVCPHECALKPGALGLCRARTVEDGQVVAENYGRLTSMAVDPIEKKPIAEWARGTRVLSVGSYGCNLRCSFCQNHEISQVGEKGVPWREVSPKELVSIAVGMADEDPGMVGVAYTYNEPLVGWEYVRDCARLVHDASLANVLVSNGCAQGWVIDELAPLIDAANIDLKCFSEAGYKSLGGDFSTVCTTIEKLAVCPTCHLEVTTLVVPGLSDDEAQMREEARWLASVDPAIVLHVTRFFPRWHMADAQPTPVTTVHRLADIAHESLEHVHIGNCW